MAAAIRILYVIRAAQTTTSEEAPEMNEDLRRLMDQLPEDTRHGIEQLPAISQEAGELAGGGDWRG